MPGAICLPSLSEAVPSLLSAVETPADSRGDRPLRTSKDCSGRVNVGPDNLILSSQLLETDHLCRDLF